MRITAEDYFNDLHNQDVAFLAIDLQNDFGHPGGSLYVRFGDKLVDVFNETVENFNNHLIYWTRDYHPANHCSFKANGGMWPAHCVRGTWGAKLMDGLTLSYDDEFIMKGTSSDVDSYSAFFDNDKKKQTELDEILKVQGVKQLFVMGLATDYCVKFTVLDAVALGYKVFVYLPGCRGVGFTPGDVQRAIDEMENAGAVIVEY